MTEPYRPQYKALISMSVKFPDGTYRDLAPGDPIPGAEKWNNPFLWAKRGHIARIDGKPVEYGSRGSYEPPRPTTTEDIKRVLSKPGHDGSPFPKAGPETIGPGEGQTPSIVDPSDREMDRKPKQAEKIDQKVIDELQARSRKELLDLAKQVNLRVNASDSKEDIARALLSQS